MMKHSYTCSICRYERKKLTYNPQTQENLRQERDPGFLENYRGYTFSFCTMQKLKQELETYFSPGHVTFDTYEDTLCVTVTTTADNRHAITEAFLQAFRAGKCCLWEYTFCLSPQDGSLSGFIGNEGLRDIPAGAVQG